MYHLGLSPVLSKSFCSWDTGSSEGAYLYSNSMNLEIPLSNISALNIAGCPQEPAFVILQETKARTR